VKVPPAPAAGVPTPATGWASLIVANLPALFADLRWKRSTLLWRGSRDGFRARDFHVRCDGHANTLTLILDKEGNIFGGFTPVEGDSTSNCCKADPSLKSFLFTLKNPHNVSARRFALKAEWKGCAIGCGSAWGPHFCDLRVSNNCSARVSETFWGRPLSSSRCNRETLETRTDGPTSSLAAFVVI
jgi:hypothetical protein